MNKKIILIVISIAVISIVGFLVFTKNSKVKKKPNSKGGFELSEDVSNENLYPVGNPNSIWDNALTAFNVENKMSYNDMIQGLQDGKVNFVWEVWALRKNCPANFTLEQCNETLLAFIDKNYTPPDSDNFKKLFKSYFQYEKFMGFEFKPPDNISFNERYTLIRSERKKVLGEENAKLFFGMEESQVDFISAQKEFIDSTKNLGGDDRVKKYDSLRKKVYGTYHDAILSREDKYQNFQTELDLRNKDLSSLSNEDREKKTRAIQEKYFGKDATEKIAKAEKEAKEADQKVEDYKKQESEFLSKNSNLNDKEKSKKLEELRSKVLGKEESEAYTRREEIEKLDKK